MLVNRVSADPDYIPVPAPDGQHGRAELAVPILIGPRLLGVLNVEGAEPFTEDDASGFELIADQLAIALENARLFAGAQANLAQLSTLYELSQRLSVADDLRALIRAALEVLAGRSPYRCTVALFDFDPAGRPARFYVPFYYQPGVGIVEAEVYLPASDDALNPLLDAGQTVAIEHVATDPRVPAFLRDDQIASGRPALALIPLVAGGRRVGNLVLSHTEPHAWTEAELRLFRSAANQLAAALDNARRFAREQERTERLALVARVGQAIAARLDPAELLATTAEALHLRLGYDHVGIFLLDEAPDGPWLVQRARASRWPRGEASHYRQPATQGVLGAAAQQRRAQVVNDVAADPRYIAVPQAEIKAELAVPLLLGERLLGVLDVAGAQPFGDDDVAGVLIVADQLAVALENADLYERAQTAGVLEERQRLARDLHDSVTQLLFSLTLIAQSIGPAYERDSAEGQRRIARVLELSQQSLAEMRALLVELRPAGPVPNGLVQALRRHLERLAARERLVIELEASRYSGYPRDAEEALYRVVQEALNNVVKHARASRVTIQLSQAEAGLTLTVTDNGQGFDTSALDSRPGRLGLIGMRERVERLRGALAITSAPGAGTEVCVQLPA
jgi:signal transduction histidine kinase